MLKEVNIQNYKSHRNTTLRFVPGINGIIGDSFSGKTTLFKAIKWLIKNSPLGFRFHSDFAKKGDPTKVQLIFDDDIKVSLSKTSTPGSSVYEIESKNKKKKFRKMVTSVPDIIKDKINIGDINFQNQLDSHFLITSTGGQIAKAISHITHADEIIIWIKNISKKLSTLETNKKTLKSDIENIDKQLVSFKGISKLKRIVSKIEKIHTREGEIEDEYYKIENLADQIKSTQRKIKAYKQYLEVKPYIRKIARFERLLGATEYQIQLILDTQKVEDDINQSIKLKNRYIKEYIQIIKKNKKCPTCFGVISSKIIRRIDKEMKT